MFALEMVIQSLGIDVSLGFEVGDGSGGISVPPPLAQLLVAGGNVADYVFPNPCPLTLSYSYNAPVTMKLKLSGGSVSCVLTLPPAGAAPKLLGAVRVQVPLIGVQEEDSNQWCFFLDADNAI